MVKQHSVFMAWELSKELSEKLETVLSSATAYKPPVGLKNLQEKLLKAKKEENTPKIKRLLKTVKMPGGDVEPVDLRKYDCASLNDLTS